MSIASVFWMGMSETGKAAGHYLEPGNSRLKPLCKQESWRDMLLSGDVVERRVEALRGDPGLLLGICTLIANRDF